MRGFNHVRTCKTLLLAGCASMFVIAAPAAAQEDDSETSESTQIVVTGSRIARPDYVASSPTVSVDDTFLQQSSTAAIEQSLNKLPQFVVSQSSTAKNNEGALLPAGGDIQPNATNTPGAANVSLRGVGSNRTLVLIDGRRGTPGNASGSVDISTIPSAALQRVEVISGGASATYGADAVAGVTNFILKKNFQGIELDGQIGLSQYADGFEYQFSGIMGTDVDGGRGNISLAMSLNSREEVLQRDRPWYRALWEDPTTTSGQFFFVPRPGVSGLGLSASGDTLTNMFPGATPPVPNNTGSVYFNPDGSIFTTGFNARGGSAAFQPWPAQDQGAFWKTTSVGTLSYINALTYLTVPTTRYNFLGRGNYEINDWIGVFAQGMFSHSETRTIQEPGPITGGWGINIPWGNGTYTGNAAVPSSVLADGSTNPVFRDLYGGMLACANGPTGCTNTEVFQAVVPANLQTLLNARGNPNAPFAITGFLPSPRETFSDVMTYNLVAGLEGSVPGTDWSWEAFVNHGVSTTLSRQTGMYSLERARTLFTSPNMGQGFRYRGNAAGGGFGASTGTCTTGMNFFGGYEGISQDCREAIAADVSNKSETRQTIAEANIQGGLFDLPAGQLRFALGASYRENVYEFANETLSTAGRSFLDQVIGIYPSSNMLGQINAKEAYGELLIPVLSDIPFIQEFNLEVGGRMSHYSTTGTSWTFKALGDWQVNDWLRFRGGFNRAERAPNIAELLLTPQQAFRTDTIGDLCSTRHNNPASANPNTNAGGQTSALDVQAVCMELMTRDNSGVFVPTGDDFSFYNPAEAQTRQGTGSTSGFGYAIGNQVYRNTIDASLPALRPEVADTWTAGAVIQSPASSGVLSRLSLSVDYFNISIKDPIGQVGAGGLLQLCVDPNFNPLVAGAGAGGLGSAQSRTAAQAAIQAAACKNVARNPSTDAGNFGQLNSASMYGTYTNDGAIKLSGIDAQLNWSANAGPGTLFLNINGNYMIDFKVQELSGGPLVDYVGTTGASVKGLNQGSSFEYRLFSTIGYNWGPASISLQWQHTPAAEDAGEALYLNGLADAGTDQSGLPAYNLFNLNTSYELNDHVRLRFGIDNLFNKWPPMTNIDVNVDPALGQLPGGGFSLLHDVQGRRFSLGATARF